MFKFRFIRYLFWIGLLCVFSTQSQEMSSFEEIDYYGEGKEQMREAFQDVFDGVVVGVKSFVTGSYANDPNIVRTLLEVCPIGG